MSIEDFNQALQNQSVTSVHDEKAIKSMNDDELFVALKQLENAEEPLRPVDSFIWMIWV